LVTWNGAPLLALWAQLACQKEWWAGKRVLELGAGTGLAGIALARLGADVTLTDMASVVDSGLLQKNVDRNCAGCAVRPSVQELTWGEEPKPPFPAGAPFDAIVACDCVYQQELIAPFVQSVRACASPHTVVYIAFQVREHIGDAGVRAALEEHGLKVESLSADEFPPLFRARAGKFRFWRVRFNVGGSPPPTPAAAAGVDEVPQSRAGPDQPWPRDLRKKKKDGVAVAVAGGGAAPAVHTSTTTTNVATAATKAAEAPAAAPAPAGNGRRVSGWWFGFVGVGVVVAIAARRAAVR
jgi:predicted nicotinamide N-methyase